MMIVGQRGRSMRAITIAALALCAAAFWSPSARAVKPGTGWGIVMSSFPTNLPPGGSGNLEIDVLETGAKPSSGSVTVTDTLPPGLTATQVGGLPEFAGPFILTPEEEEGSFGGARWSCSGTTVVTCTSNPAFLPSMPVGAGNAAIGAERLGIKVEVAPNASGALPNRVSVSGGGASTATSVTSDVMVSSSEPGFGFPQFDPSFTNADGTPDTQAGSHPYDAIFVLGLNELSNGQMAGGEVRNLEVATPPGLFGDPNAVPQCTRSQLDVQNCPAQSQIGTVDVETSWYTGGGRFFFVPFPVYNMVPPPGVPNEFAFSVGGKHALFDAGVSSGHGYSIVEHVNNIPQVPRLDGTVLTLWGVPADPGHNRERNAESNGIEGCREGCGVGITVKPFLTLPTSCLGPQTFTVRGLATWSDPGASAESSAVTHDGSDSPAGFTGCEHLSVDPTLSAVPDTSFADTPTGFNVDVRVPQESLTFPESLVASTIRNTTVTLPEGVVINPGQGAGLVACQEAEANIHGEGPSSCPAASKVGTVHIRTPLLEGELESELAGNIYVLQSNPPNLKILLAASGDGIFLKLVGDIHLDETTGRLTTTFAETPALPFTDLKISFSGGGQAALDTPTSCGSFTSTSDFTPWTSPFTEDLFPSSSFAIVAGPGGSACSSPMPFTPSMIAGATTDQAGGFTNFSLLLQRDDGQQRIRNLQFKTPEGLLGMISRVPLCGEPQAAQGTCSAASQIGHTVVAAGPGPYPLVVPQPGKPPAPIYLTGGYKGAPYGLSIVVPVVAGPFDLGTVVVRAKIEVDSHTSQLTVTTDPLPVILDGIPADLRTINAVIDRPEFMFNPTNCEPQAFSGTATSIEGVQAPISSHFQMGSCRALTFKPNFKVSTSGKTSRKNGASLEAKVLYPTGALGANQASSQSNIKSVKVSLPKQLPSRLSTLQKACTAKTFEANPANCPAASLVGHATAITPVLPVPLTGPAYFVSHGGEAFPSLIVVLQGYGVTIDLVGSTFIDSKTNITSSTFKQVPDVPITSFDLKLPQGPFSALAATSNLCKTKLKMPTLFTAQDGATIKQATPIAVTGCPKAKTKAKKTKTAVNGKHKRGKK